MKRSTTIKILATLCIATSLCAFAACSKGGDKDKDNPVGLITELPEGGNKEIYCDISVEMAGGYIDGTFLVPEVSVTYDGKPVTVDEEKIFTLTELGEYTLTFTFELPNGKKEEKVVVINSVDSTAPTVVNRMETQYAVGEEVDLTSEVYIRDMTDDAPQISYQVKLGDTSVPVTDGKFTVAGEGRHTVNVTVKDKHGNTGTSNLGFIGRDPYALENFDYEELFLGSTVSYGGATLTRNTDEKYVKGGEGSLKYVKAGTSTAFALPATKDIVWGEDAKGLSFWVYNPSETYDYTIGFAGYKALSGGVNGQTNGNSIFSISCSKKAWTPVTISAEELKLITQNGSPYFAITIFHTNNGEVGSAQWENIELYFDEFTLLEEASEANADLDFAKGVFTNSASVCVTTNPTYLAQGSQYALWYQPLGTWNGFYMSNSNLNWQTDNVKNVTFKVYNPSSHTVYAWASHGDGTASVYSGTIMELATGWNTVVLGTNEFADGEYLTFASHYGNVGTGNNGANGSEQFKEHQEKGLYFDDFVITYWQEGEKEALAKDLAWAEGTNTTGSIPATSTENLATGSKYSLHFMPSGTWNSMFLNNSKKYLSRRINNENKVRTYQSGLRLARNARHCNRVNAHRA